MLRASFFRIESLLSEKLDESENEHSLVVRRMHAELEAWHLVLVTSRGNESLVNLVRLVICKLLERILCLLVLLLRVEVDQLASDLFNNVCTMGFGSILVHLEDHVGLTEVDAVGNRHSLVFLVLLNDALVFGHTREARGLLRT